MRTGPKIWLMRLLTSPIIILWHILGWRVVGKLPELDKMVIIAAPHTSNWDFIVFMALAGYLGIIPTVLAKHTLMRWPLGVLIRFMGGIPIDRRAPHGVVGQIVNQFAEREQLILLLSPEGTRKRTEYWKTGFYNIAMKAQVPILIAFINRKKRLAGFGPLLHPTGDVQADFNMIRDFYEANGNGINSENFGPVRVQQESQPER